VINRPDVFKAATSDTFVIFGEAKVEDASASAQAEDAAQFARAPAAGGVDASRARAAAAASGAAAAAPAAAAAGGDEDASGVEEKDIKLVMDQAGVERSAAIRALKKNNSDIVSAIMELTM
jgi:nascent polypeptide-associated complex subunit alpha